MRGPQAVMGARFNIQYGSNRGVQRAVTGGIRMDGDSLIGPFPGRTPVAQYGVARIRPSGALPPASSFISAEPFAAWWTYREGNVNQACAVQGAAMLLRVRRALGLSSGVWDAALQQALIARITALPNQSSWASVLTALNADLSIRRASRLSHQIAIWLTYYQQYNRRLDAISIPDNAQLLVWGESPLTDGQSHPDDVLCFDPAIESLPLTVSDQATAISESNTGIRVGTGRALPPTADAAPDPISEGTSGWRLAVVAAGILSVLWVVTSD